VFHQKMCGQDFNCCIDEMHTLIVDQVRGQPNLVKMFSYRNFVVITTMLVRNALASTHLVA
jgi:hypothetical protein